MDTLLWTSKNGKYELVKGDGENPGFCLYVDGSEIEIWWECDGFISNTLRFYDIPKYVKTVLDKYIGDIIY